MKHPLIVDLGGVILTLDPDLYPNDVPTNGLNWLHCQYNEVSGSLFTSLHIDNDELIKSITRIHVIDSNGYVVLDEENFVIDMSVSDVQVTYVTSRNKYQELVVHYHNYGNEDHIIGEVIVNTGFYSTTNVISLSSKSHVVQVYNVSELNLHETSVWTITFSSESKSIAYGGRLTKEYFPIEDWPKSSQCPVPVDGGNEDNYNILKNELHINTHFFGPSCDSNSEDVFNYASLSNGELYLLPEEKYSLEEGRIPDTAYDGIGALFLGDESDSSVENTWSVWNRALTAQEVHNNKYALYCGGHSNHLNGLFSGISDIQGMDFYVASCAPHITNWLSTMLVEGSYDYLYNTRQNHKPLPTWLYSQGYCQDCWHVKEMYVGELLVQFSSVVAAGGKGMMLFQSDISLRGTDSWEAGSRYLRSISLISEFLRQADVEGAKYTISNDAKTISEVLVDTTSLLFIVINIDSKDYNNKKCFGTGAHWTFNEQTVQQVTIQLPNDLLLLAESSQKLPSDYYQLVEVIDGQYVSDPEDVEMGWNDENTSVVINEVKLGTADTVVRMFMIIPQK